MADDPVEAEIRKVLDWTAGQVEPDFSKLCDALGMELDAGAFSIGMMTVTFIMQRMNMVEIAKGPYGHLLREFVENCRAAHRG